MFRRFILQALLKSNWQSASLDGVQQTRTTFVVKRQFPPHLSKVGYRKRKLRGLNYVYDLVEDTNVKKKENITVILTEDVEGIGNKGEVVDIRPGIFHYQLLPSQQAIHASPENLKKLEEDKAKGLIKGREKQSSPWAPKTAKDLTDFILAVVMNLEQTWTIEPWHMRVAFRKAGYCVPEDAITMPTHSISGPNMDLEGKEFLIQVTINNREKTYVRCRLHHWSTDIGSRLPPIPDHWRLPADPAFNDDIEVLKSLPLPKCVSSSGK